MIRPCFGTALAGKMFLHYNYIKGQKINLVEVEWCFSNRNYVTQSASRSNLNCTLLLNVKYVYISFKGIVTPRTCEWQLDPQQQSANSGTIMSPGV